MRWSEGGKFENPEPGSHLARCYAVIDLGSQPHTWGDEIKLSRDVRISFELPHSLMEGLYNAEMRGKPFTAHLTVKQSLHPAARLRKLLEGWRGKRFEAASIEAFNPSNLVGQCCRLSLILSDSGYVNIDSIATAKKDEIASMPAKFNAGVFFSLAPEEFSQRVFDGLSDKTKEKIKATPEWAYLMDPKSNANDAYAEQDMAGDKPSSDPIPF